MKVTNASFAFYMHKKRPKWAESLKPGTICHIDGVINSQAGIRESDGEREWGNLCRLLLGVKRLHARGATIYGETTLADYLRHIGPAPGTVLHARLKPREKCVIRLLRRLEKP